MKKSADLISYHNSLRLCRTVQGCAKELVQISGAIVTVQGFQRSSSKKIYEVSNIGCAALKIDY